MKNLAMMFLCVGALTACAACTSAPKQSDEAEFAAASEAAPVEPQVAAELPPAPTVAETPAAIPAPAPAPSASNLSLGAGSSGRGH